MSSADSGRDVVIVAARTPIGTFGGADAVDDATGIGVAAIAAAHVSATTWGNGGDGAAIVLERV